MAVNRAGHSGGLRRLRTAWAALGCALSLSAQESAETSLIAQRWSLGPDREARITGVRAHKPSYFLPARYSYGVNPAPVSPTQAAAPQASQPTETKFQLSFKFLLWSGDDAQRLALWAAYTQQSSWQVFNAGASRPFRETNYEPELILAWRPDKPVLGLDWRLLSVGLNHQSNGQADPLSRSWNRIVFQAGFERNGFVLLLRPWLRLRETVPSDNNPDLEHYLGHGEAVALWRLGGHTLTAKGQLNAAAGHGAIQGSWSFPMPFGLHGYLQVHRGYGETLVDYNWCQTTVGAGISLSEWF